LVVAAFGMLRASWMIVHVKSGITGASFCLLFVLGVDLGSINLSSAKNKSMYFRQTQIFIQL
jgi:hypothetical protein